MLSAKGLLELAAMNREWFLHHRHLSTDEMIEKGLIDECDRGWVDKMREEYWKHEVERSCSGL